MAKRSAAMSNAAYRTIGERRALKPPKEAAE